MISRLAILEPMLVAVLRWLVAAIFLTAAVPKIMDPARFAVDIANYRLLPHAWIHLVAITLPWIEAVPAVLLIAGRWRRSSAFVIAALTSVFVLAIASAMARGLNIECGCFGTIAGRKGGAAGIAEDLILLAMAAYLCWRERDEPSRPAADDLTPTLSIAPGS